ncbi:apoptosis-inducing factor 3-like [Clytia hemisphaerica]|uniref:apoptosis-inducing factor 3-like n=1 Tax=Clytia hemisphaerica TaxID=252671 RepID=UPI0034D50245
MFSLGAIVGTFVGPHNRAEVLLSTSERTVNSSNIIINNNRKQSHFQETKKNRSSTGKMLEQEVCNESDVSEGQMKQVEFGSGKILLSKYNGQISAVSGKCTHYGAPLITGAYKDGKVRCPWHGACFNAVTGDIEDFPGLDSLHKYEVAIKNGKVIVKGSENTLKDFRCIKPMEDSCATKEIFLIIGGGGAAITCAETLRQQGFTGKIIMATSENHVPYDRPKLSKMLNAEPSKLYLRTPEFLKEKNIEVLYGKKAMKVDLQDKTVVFEDGTSQKYTKLFTATGGSPKLLNVPGSELGGVLYLRTPDDANQIDKLCPEKEIVILGTGFISMELAAYFSSKCKSVTVIGSGRTKYPFEKLLGDRIGKMYYNQHTSKGVKLIMDSPVKELVGENGKVAGVVLSNGQTIKADVVLVGIGVTPSTKYFNGAGVQMNSLGYVIVDKYLCASSDVYCGGDIVSFPYHYGDNEMINIGHWQLASNHGRCAAMNMLGKETPCVTVPFFWTQQYGKSLRYAGYAGGYDEILYEGNVEELTFAAYYFRKGKFVAIACINMGAKASEMALLIQDNQLPSMEDMKAKITSKE